MKLWCHSTDGSLQRKTLFMLQTLPLQRAETGGSSLSLRALFVAAFGLWAELAATLILRCSNFMNTSVVSVLNSDTQQRVVLLPVL